MMEELTKTASSIFPPERCPAMAAESSNSAPQELDHQDAPVSAVPIIAQSPTGGSRFGTASENCAGYLQGSCCPIPKTGAGIQRCRWMHCVAC